MDRTALPAASSTVPRHPAWTIPTAWRAGSYSRIGVQSRSAWSAAAVAVGDHGIRPRQPAPVRDALANDDCIRAVDLQTVHARVSSRPSAAYRGDGSHARCRVVANGPAQVQRRPGAIARAAQPREHAVNHRAVSGPLLKAVVGGPVPLIRCTRLPRSVIRQQMIIAQISLASIVAPRVTTGGSPLRPPEFCRARVCVKGGESVQWKTCRTCSINSTCSCNRACPGCADRRSATARPRWGAKRTATSRACAPRSTRRWPTTTAPSPRSTRSASRSRPGTHKPTRRWPPGKTPPRGTPFVR